MESSTNCLNPGGPVSLMQPPRKVNMFVCYNSSSLSLTHPPQRGGYLPYLHVVSSLTCQLPPLEYRLLIPFFTRYNHFFKSRFIKTHIRSTVNNPGQPDLHRCSPGLSKAGQGVNRSRECLANTINRRLDIGCRTESPL